MNIIHYDLTWECDIVKVYAFGELMCYKVKYGDTVNI